MKTRGLFTQQVWELVHPTFQEITSCRFVCELADGSLPKSCFAHYLTQDVLYLIKDAEALGNLSKRATMAEDQLFFEELRNDGLQVELLIREEYLGYYELQEATSQSKAFADYSDFLLRHSLESSYEVACAALLPCFWIYGAVCDFIIARMTQNNPYQKFISTYSGDEYYSYLNTFIEIVEQNFMNSCFREDMINVFIEASEHELRIFEESMLPAK